MLIQLHSGREHFLKKPFHRLRVLSTIMSWSWWTSACRLLEYKESTATSTLSQEGWMPHLQAPRHFFPLRFDGVKFQACHEQRRFWWWPAPTSTQFEASNIWPKITPCLHVCTEILALFELSQGDASMAGREIPTCSRTWPSPCLYPRLLLSFHSQREWQRGLYLYASIAYSLSAFWAKNNSLKSLYRVPESVCARSRV